MTHIDPDAPLEQPQPTQTPNVVIGDPALRRKLTTTLSILSLLVGIAVLFFAFFPEVGGDVANRAIQFVSAVIILVAGFFQLTVTRPNIPTV